MKTFNKNFDQIFNLKVEKNTVNQYVCSISRRNHTDASKFIGDASNDRKTSEFQVCKNMWEHLRDKGLTEESNICGPQLRYDALLGDKTLDYLLGLHFYNQGKGSDVVSDLHNLISSRSNNDRLRERMGKIGLKKTGNLIMDASRVEQWVWQQHVECLYDPYKTLQRIAFLLE